MPSLDTTLVVKLHTALRRTGLGGRLPYQSLIAFLHFGSARTEGFVSPDNLDEIVEVVIDDIEMLNEINNIETTRTVSKLTNGLADLTAFLSGLKVALEEIVNLFKAQAIALREQHGGVTKHASIEDLMNKIGNCVDKTALKVLNEQVFAIHAEQLATANSNGIRYIEKCIGLIDQALTW